MTYVRANGDQIVTYPYSMAMLRADNPDVSFPREPNDEALAEFGVYRIGDSEPPTGEWMKAVPAEPVFVNGAWVKGWSLVRRMVRKSTITNRLIAAGKMEAAHAALMSDAANFARWIAADRPSVYADDPDAHALLTAIDADAATIMAEDDLL